MAKPIQWLRDLDAAKKKAQAEGKYVLLDFFNSPCMGCQQMDAVSYPNAKVIDFFSKYVAPVRVPVFSTPLPQQFKVKWTPTFVILDSQGEEHHRSVGFLPPEELIPSLTLGMVKTWFDHGQFSEAISLLDRLISEYPKSDVSLEASYYRGVSRYKAINDTGALKQAHETLQANHKKQRTGQASPGVSTAMNLDNSA